MNMCGRWYVDLMADYELNQYYNKLKNKKGIKTSGDVFPSDHVMVIAKSQLQNINVFNMKWGYKVGNKLVFNARFETLYNKEIFVDGINNRRCVIPASFYYEWQKETKEKNIIKDMNSSTMYFLGIYRFENDEPVCTIITKEASLSLKPLHERMPVIIKKEQIDSWLNDCTSSMSIINESINELIFYKDENN